MNGIATVAAAAISFVGSHFVLSHPLRRPLVARIGETGFSILYSVVAIATLGWLSKAAQAAPATDFLWPVGDGIWALATVLMLVASVLLMGSLIGNPALPGPAGALPEQARGVFAITRHPMMWSFALWGFCHILVYPQAATIVVALAIIVLALVGAALQDRKKERLQPERWPTWEARTSFWPLAAVASGRAQLTGLKPHTWLGGVVVWLAATWAHIPLAGWPAGIWRWIG
ncbi:NnrU family protein [Lichenihabitans sp. Uapishka_5]|uniref:NnrU family protein n=1 Tax=Lichenihabitans sp. Uapishka_5 TaxID=3037302 RepID=UPI0029E7E8C9|nr:NnrU family protein [Lichenihabitans sp. Uapishka_5]MDX7950696.1 NnrU family protein [Lichenihabitans sp. Uapishka_5]